MSLKQTAGRPLPRFFRLPVFSSTRFLVALYLLVTVLAACQQLWLGQINNYLIFKFSFPHLLHGQNLYTFYPHEYFDNYKYGPVFGLLMAPFAALPDWLGVPAWTLLNTCLFCWALLRMPVPHKQKVFVFWFVLIEFLTATQNLQANPMLTAMMLAIFIFFERRRVFWAAALVALGGFFKVYGFIGGAFFLLYPQKGRFLASFAFWCAVLFALPMLLVPPGQVVFLYKEWYHALADKTGYHHDISMIWLLQSVSGLAIPDAAVVLGGVGLFCLAYLKWRSFGEAAFRLRFLSLVLVWMVIFSPGAESATYIIAVTGVGLWYAASDRAAWKTVLLGGVLLLTILSPTDVFPAYLRETFVIPYALKALPCGLVWGAVLYELLAGAGRQVGEARLVGAG